MDKKQIDSIAKQIAELENDCQNGNNINENMQKMDALLEGITLDELFEITLKLESMLPKIDK
jgi:DNA-binding IscR family transcriptional regulator